WTRCTRRPSAAASPSTYRSGRVPIGFAIFPFATRTGTWWKNREPERDASRSVRSEEHTSELQSRFDLVCRLLLEKKKNQVIKEIISLHPLKSGDLCLLLFLTVSLLLLLFALCLNCFEAVKKPPPVPFMVICLLLI